jgi:long-subunit acyl-CoA synthetase (AMP-forming)
MKNLVKLTSTIAIGAVLALLTACQTTGTTSATAQNEAILAQSGFKTVAVTTPKQQQAVSKLPQGTVSPVKYKGKQYYVYPTASNDKIYVGKQAHVNAAKQAYAAQQAQAQSSMNPPPTMTFQGHGQHGVVAEEFDGFGPMGVNALGDW